MMRRFSILAATLFCSVLSIAENPLDFSSLETTALQEMKETGTPGLAFAVIHGDRMVLAKGLGVSSIETKQPVTPQTLFQLGSVTKMFTAAALLSVLEEKHITVNEPAGKYIEGLSPEVAKCTIHQLLSHSSGLKDEPADYGTQEETALREYVRSWKNDYRLIPPGIAFSYSNAGYSLAGAILQEIGQKPYADMMTGKLFGPLQMDGSTFRPGIAITYPVASGHRTEGNHELKVVCPVANDTRHWPAGYLFSSVSDLSRFFIAFLNRGILQGKRILAPSVIQELSTAHIEVPADNLFAFSRYGYGLFIHEYRKVTMLEHEGDMPGFSAQVWMVPEQRLAVIVLANKEGSRMVKTLNKALDLYIKHPEEQAITRPKEFPLSADEIGKYSGRYTNRWTIELLSRDGKLFLKQFGTELLVSKIGEHRFCVTRQEASKPDEFLMFPSGNGKPGYLQMFLWAFRKEG